MQRIFRGDACKDKGEGNGEGGQRQVPVRDGGRKDNL